MLSGNRKVRRLRQLAAAATGLSLSLSAGAVAITDDFEVAGFARIVGGYMDGAGGQDYNGYTDDVSLQQESLLALQPTFSFTDTLSVTGQFIAHSDDNRDSGTEWAYLSYRPSNAWHFRAGKLRMPFFSYSDSLDVGYSYPWISPPAQVYRNYLFSTFEGISGSYNYAGESFALNLENYYGYYDGPIRIAGTRVDVDGELNDLRGLVININSHNVGLRLSYHTGFNESIIYPLLPFEDALNQTGFPDSARSINSRGKVVFREAALTYDTLSTFYKAEWVHTTTEFQIAPALTGYYFTAGYIFGNWTLHGTYASNSYSNTHPQTELQDLLDSGALPPDSPQFAQLSELAGGYYLLFNSLPDGALDTYTLGLRWDFDINMALKADISYLNETSPRSGFFATPSTGFYTESNIEEKFQATLYQLGWEWIF
ncbi:MAG: hypothetical protein CMI13_04685 [Oleibacter sp.]|nr:hypothetical protein [Thalassolituus sp.]